MKLLKVTNDPVSATKRRYDDACGTALALEFIGERWSLLVMREMVYGPRRFGELKANLPGISANILTQRLDALAAAGIVIRKRLPSPANVQVYDLTDWGREAAPLIRDMGRWAARSPLHDPMLFMSPTSAMMSLSALIDRPRLADLSMSTGFRFPSESFVATIAAGDFAVCRGDPLVAEIVFTGDTMAMRRSIYGKAPLTPDGAGGTLAVDGDLDRAARFVDLFRLPTKIG